MAGFQLPALVLLASLCAASGVSLRSVALARPGAGRAAAEEEAEAALADGTTAPPRPPLALTFEGVVALASGELQRVSVDRQRLAIAVSDLPLQRGGQDKEGALRSAARKPQDGAIIDLARGRSYMHQRFFDELVCYAHDLEGSAAPQPSRWLDRSVVAAFASAVDTGSSSTPQPAAAASGSGGNHSNRSVEDPLLAQRVKAAQEAFKDRMLLGALSDVLRTPLDLYFGARDVQHERHIAGLACSVWAVNQSLAMPLQDLLEAAAGSMDFGGPQLPSLKEVLEQVQNATDGEVAERPQNAVMAVNAAFCVTPRGQLLGVDASRSITVSIRRAHADPKTMTLWSDVGGFALAAAPRARPPAARFEAERGAAGGRCVDLTSGSTGRRELGYRLNSPERIRRINSEAGGTWVAKPYHIWSGMTVAEIVPALGTHIEPLRLPLGTPMRGRSRHGGLALLSRKPMVVPENFDARARWPHCNTISYIRNQGMCGSCWAFAATGVLSDRFCIAAVPEAPRKLTETSASGLGGDRDEAASLLQSKLQSMALSPEHLVDCDSDNAGCSGGRLDDVWWYLRDHGVPTESCRPYRYCPVPTHPRCGGDGARPSDPEAFLEQKRVKQTENRKNWCSKDQAECAGSRGGVLVLHRASAAYAVAAPGDVPAMQRELLMHGPMEVGFFVFSDFHSYRRGVYFRTPGAFGPLGGHAVRLIGWGTAQTRKAKSTDYWLAANSWSPVWGMSGFFRIRRGTNECGIETTPAAGLPRLEGLSSSEHDGRSAL